MPAYNEYAVRAFDAYAVDYLAHIMGVPALIYMVQPSPSPDRVLFLSVVKLLATMSPLWWALWVLWRLRWGGGVVGKGLRLESAGRAVDAERCYRKALHRSWLSASKRAGVLCCLGSVLMDQGRYEESRKCLDEALAMGSDPAGSCRSNIAELLLLQGIEAQQALDMADEAFEATISGFASVIAGRVGLDLASVARATIVGQRAWALALLGRQEEAQQAIFEALQLMIQPSAELLKNYYGFGRVTRMGRADTYWLTGMALLSMKETGKASEHFKKGAAADPKCKYGALCRKQLALAA